MGKWLCVVGWLVAGCTQEGDVIVVAPDPSASPSPSDSPSPSPSPSPSAPACAWRGERLLDGAPGDRMAIAVAPDGTVHALHRIGARSDGALTEHIHGRSGRFVREPAFACDLAPGAAPAAVGGDGVLYVACRHVNAGGWGYRVLKFGIGGWSGTLDRSAEPGSAGVPAREHLSPAFAVDPAGRVHLAGVNQGDVSQLEHSWQSPTGWQHELLPPSHVMQPVVRFGAAGQPRFFYLEALGVSTVILREGRPGPGGWSSVELAKHASWAGLELAVLIDARDRTHAVYSDQTEYQDIPTPGILWYLQRAAGTPGVRVLDGAGSYGSAAVYGAPGLAETPDGQLHLLYNSRSADGLHGGLVHRWSSPAGWDSAIIAPAATSSPLLAAGPDGTLHALYARDFDASIEYATRACAR